MNFVEKLTSADVIRLAAGRGTLFYGVLSLGARLALRIFAMAGLDLKLRAWRIDFGYLQTAAGIRGNAYKAAEAVIDRLPGRRWADALSPALGIDFWLIVRKFFFDEYYVKFEFLEMALRYADEHPQEAHAMRVDADQLDAYAERLARCFDLRQARGTGAPGACALVLLPPFVEYFSLRRGQPGALAFQDHLVCEVDGDKTLEMFSSLLRDAAPGRVAYVAEQRNAPTFAAVQHVGTLGLRREGLRFLRRAAWRYLAASLRHRGEVAGFGTRLFRLFYILMQGRAEVVEGSGNAYFTYEHFVTVKAVRNEFLRAAGSRSIFVPLNAHVTPQYFHSEILMNYDVVCAAGEHTEALYRKKRVLTPLFLPTGSYECHRRFSRAAGRDARMARLKAFKGDSVAVTIVSPGLADATFGVELKLMALARALAALPRVCVLVRMKPVAPAQKYAGFYEQQSAGCAGILLAGDDYDLFDFFDLSDLFVTSVSNAAFDLAQGGAQVMFIDYFRDPDLLLCLSSVPGVMLSEEQSLAAVTDWIQDRDRVRDQLRARMKEFAAHIAYHHRDFEAYRRNFVTLLATAGVPGVASSALARAA